MQKLESITNFFRVCLRNNIPVCEKNISYFYFLVSETWMVQIVASKTLLCYKCNSVESLDRFEMSRLSHTLLEWEKFGKCVIPLIFPRFSANLLIATFAGMLFGCCKVAPKSILRKLRPNYYCDVSFQIRWWISGQRNCKPENAAWLLVENRKIFYAIFKNLWEQMLPLIRCVF